MLSLIKGTLIALGLSLLCAFFILPWAGFYRAALACFALSIICYAAAWVVHSFQQEEGI